MKQSTYTRTALASLLTLCSFGGFSADFSDESIKKQESAVTSGKMEVMKTSNKKLKEKMDRICNADPKKEAEELKKKEELKLVSKEQTKQARDSRAKTLNVKNSNIEGSKTKNSKTQKAEIEVKAVNKNIEEKGKASPVASVGGVDIVDANRGANGLRITFGGIVDAQGYGKAGIGSEDYKSYNIKTGKSVNYYNASEEQIKGANSLFPGGIGNIGDYSENMGMIADAILHLRAENKNEDLGLLYGADVQFHIPVTEGKAASQGVNAARGRSAHVFLNSKYGDLKLGYQFGPEALMRVDATRIATVDGAADSDWFRKMNLEGSAATFPFYVTPRLYTESFSSESERLSFRMAGKYNKGVMTTLPFRIAYYSPSHMGARFGISYSPRYEGSLFSVSEGSSAIDFDSGIENVADEFIKAGNLSYSGREDLTDAIKAVVDPAVANDTGATVAEKWTAIDKAATDLFNNIKQPDAGSVTTEIAKNKTVRGMVSGLTIDPTDVGTISALAATDRKYANKDTFRLALVNKIGDDYFKNPDTGKEDLKGARAAVNAVIKEAVEGLISDSNKDRINTKKRQDIKNRVKEIYGNAILLDAIKNGPHGNSAIRHVGPDYEHIISAGASYEYDFSQHNIKVKTSAVGEYGHAKKTDSAKYAYKEFVEYN
ncbi:WD0745 family porin, partial [Wolbachia endosymbiont of Mansonella ozzardi]